MEFFLDACKRLLVRDPIGKAEELSWQRKFHEAPKMHPKLQKYGHLLIRLDTPRLAGSHLPRTRSSIFSPDSFGCPALGKTSMELLHRRTTRTTRGVNAIAAGLQATARARRHASSTQIAFRRSEYRLCFWLVLLSEMMVR